MTIVSLNLRYHCRKACLSPYNVFLSLHTMCSFPLKENPQADSYKIIPTNFHLERLFSHPFDIALSHNELLESL